MLLICFRSTFRFSCLILLMQFFFFFNLNFVCVCVNMQQVVYYIPRLLFYYELFL